MKNLNTFRGFLRSVKLCSVALCAVAITSCGGGGGGSDDGSSKAARTGGSSAADFDCAGLCTNQNITAAEVRKVLGQGVAAANSLGVKATFAVTDRVGNVLAVYQMPGATGLTTIMGPIGAVGGLEGVPVPSSVAAISKAGTGAYLSSQGNAFSTRTASQIVQEHFDPGERDQPGGPLFGVQFSQLICSDVTTRNPEVALKIGTGSFKTTAGGLVGPRPLPLGLSADPGGIPLYKQGDLVGGLGVELDGLYTFDRDIRDEDDAPEERIALMASIGFEAPGERVASNMIVGGRALRYSDLGYDDLGEIPPAEDIVDSNLLNIPEYTNGVIKDGAVFGTAASGFARTIRAGQPAIILVNGAGGARFPSINGASLGGAELKANEVEALLDSAILTAYRSRAAIRRPLDSPVHVSIWVIDHLGNPLGFTRTFDAPVFGTDVSLQKARAAAFFSSKDAGAMLDRARLSNGVGAFEDYAGAARAFVTPTTFSDGVAYSNRAVGNLARPFFIDGIEDGPNGPLSLPFPGKLPGRSWSPFNDGLQLDLVFQRLVGPLGVPSAPSSIPDTCTDKSVFGRRLANGIQIFPGSVPVFRGTTLIGAVGISGDGIDQDDMVSFLGSSRRGLDFAGHPTIGDPVLGFNAPIEMRSDQVTIAARDTARLRYVNCPESAFIGGDDQNVCDGL